MTFSDLNLNAPLLNALDDLGYTNPTTIQRKVFSVIMSGQDVCGIAQTGTGKTFAYLLPTLRLMKFSKTRTPQMLIIVPTRELVAQVVTAIKDLTAYMTIEVIGVYGGVNINPQKAAVEAGCDILVATPGRLLDLALDGSLSMKTIKKLVIDEMDEMLNLGFRTQLNNILDLLPAKRQNLLFSATITADVELMMQMHFNDPVRIEAAPTGTPLENIDQTAYYVPNFYTKINLLEKLLAEDADMSKVLIFAATKQMADQLFEQLEPKFPEKAGVIHSNKEQNHRFNTVKQFQEGNYRFIIATDIVARGIDIAEVSHVINFDTPEVPENYIHRIGRTGRADRKGIAITFITEKEKEDQAKIEALMKYTIPISPLPDDLEISDVLTEDEKPKVFMKTIQFKIPKKEESGPAFHPKSAKNSKVNKKVSRKEQMQKKYGKPKTRGQKK
ncbi:DEAD/DEAH box helicase [Chitinophagaceae bacterium LWZ2-11]